MMAPTDPHQGGHLEDMAAEEPPFRETQASKDWYALRVQSVVSMVKLTITQIPSVPRLDQKDPGPEFSHTNPAHAADNAFDIPRGVNDQGPTGEVISGRGDQINSNIEKKNLDDADKVPEAKGHDRYAKHVRKQQSDFDENSGQVKASHGVEAAPGEELLTQDELLKKRGAA
ncbi:hypothetical protein E8E12_009030 [Didymella heteroderae]|uniref:Uncharacterized protein n=1 Tax=Didymella heteroderae TaxID=1769908 RepID=A0A9P5C497_9PLEO|nr:hypothetical protein E8E12_009030 [Didymella heteroderae]